jgi:hypothetical protein
MQNGNGFYSKGHLDWFQKHGQALPVHETHGEDSQENPISRKLQSVNPRNWRLNGNVLIADTDMGTLKQTIPPDYILTGEKNGLPTFKKFELTPPKQ